MSVKKKVILVFLFAAVVLVNVGILRHQPPQSDNVSLHLSVCADEKSEITAFYSVTNVFDIEHAKTESYETPGTVQRLVFDMDSLNTAIRLDFGDGGTKFQIRDVYYEYRGERADINSGEFGEDSLLENHNVGVTIAESGLIEFEVRGEDPYLAIAVGPSVLQKQVTDHLHTVNWVKIVLLAGLFDLACLAVVCFRKKFFSLPLELIQNRKLIMSLAKNDFKTKYAGSYLGITWAFVQPIITVLVYWFVFQVGLRSGNIGNFPFVLWLVAGLVPWFFFQDTLNGGTNALIEYSYLVKKVVFKISVLPIVKAVSALFVHAFFVAFMLVLYTCYGYFPDLYVLQVVYYTAALFLFTLGICYATCAIVIFFRDLTQIINIVLQIGVWMTPIMWNIEVLGADFPEWLTMIFKANPLYYIVNGYRDALINKVWFWERFDLTFYYWIVTTVLFAVGTIIFKRLKVHFADIL